MFMCITDHIDRPVFCREADIAVQERRVLLLLVLLVRLQLPLLVLLVWSSTVACETLRERANCPLESVAVIMFWLVAVTLYCLGSKFVDSFLCFCCFSITVSPTLTLWSLAFVFLSRYSVRCRFASSCLSHAFRLMFSSTLFFNKRNGETSLSLEHNWRWRQFRCTMWRVSVGE